MPFAVPAGMALIFRAAVRRWGPRRGYIGGFAAYWAVCLGLPLALLGPRRFAELVTGTATRLPRPRALAVAALAMPPLGGIAVELLPALGGADARLIGASIGLAAVNATADEALWRGLPAIVFPDDALRGWLLPAIGFTAWHAVPLAAGGWTRRAAVLLAGAAMIGLGYGWVAWRTGSIRWTLPPHIVTDASGLRAVSRQWLGRAARAA